ncbi:ferritin-like domain-containing protein [Viridibacillus sp. YIM B01967]|uniref:Ferritin-like domain-containing protein n=1 Tax=Viridibacillus soli TaxID=2798301 RepID=A0ABS1H937_9BACL|nr:ferritin-like domain-containing protein [Viridibacillus soli]MBK3495932.1 ferritin-like domain-containing protein [Viridibacillus soli]
MFEEQLKKAIQDEYQSYYWYKSMLELTKDPTWRSYLERMITDQKCHYEMFQQLYYMLTEKYVQKLTKKPPCKDFKACVKEALGKELEATDLYKEMFLNVPIEQGQYPLFIAMQDGMEHAIRFSTIYNAL